jgi:plasmid maintenance system antidote protein VapI
MEVSIDVDDGELFNAVESDVLNLIEQNDDITNDLLDALQGYLNQDQDALCDLGQAFEAAVRKAVYAVLKGE